MSSEYEQELVKLHGEDSPISYGALDLSTRGEMDYSIDSCPIHLPQHILNCVFSKHDSFAETNRILRTHYETYNRNRFNFKTDVTNSPLQNTNNEERK